MLFQSTVWRVSAHEGNEGKWKFVVFLVVKPGYEVPSYEEIQKVHDRIAIDHNLGHVDNVKRVGDMDYHAPSQNFLSNDLMVDGE